MNKEKRSLRRYLDDKSLDVMEFSVISDVHWNTLYAIVNGKKNPRRKTASRICRATKGELTLKDFGYD